MRAVVIVGPMYFATQGLIILLIGTGALLGPVVWAAYQGAVIFATIAVALFGFFTSVKSLCDAIEKKDMHWALDAFMAPTVAILVLFFVFLGMHVWRDWLLFLIMLAHKQTLPDLAIGFCNACLWWVLAIGGPVVAFRAMKSEDGADRLVVYPAYIITAFTWGLFCVLLAGANLAG